MQLLKHAIYTRAIILAITICLLGNLSGKTVFQQKKKKRIFFFFLAVLSFSSTLLAKCVSNCTTTRFSLDKITTGDWAVAKRQPHCLCNIGAAAQLGDGCRKHKVKNKTEFSAAAYRSPWKSQETAEVSLNWGSDRRELQSSEAAVWGRQQLRSHWGQRSPGCILCCWAQVQPPSLKLKAPIWDFRPFLLSPHLWRQQKVLQDSRN